MTAALFMWTEGIAVADRPCVIQDYYNLVDVYLDAVLYPNCVQDPKTFAQEGWHYELENPEVSEREHTSSEGVCPAVGGGDMWC